MHLYGDISLCCTAHLSNVVTLLMIIATDIYHIVAIAKFSFDTIILSLSIRYVHCDKMNESSVYILISHERSISV